MAARKKLPISIQRMVLHESGYKCSNPTCRTIITLDLHHLAYVSKGGKNEAENLLALCPNCHSLHHKRHIPQDSLRTWKMLQISLNEAFDKRSIDLLLTIHKQRRLDVSGEGVLDCASLISSEFVKARELVGSLGGACWWSQKSNLQNRNH